MTSKYYERIFQNRISCSSSMLLLIRWANICVLLQLTNMANFLEKSINVKEHGELVLSNFHDTFSHAGKLFNENIFLLIQNWKIMLQLLLNTFPSYIIGEEKAFLYSDLVHFLYTWGLSAVNCDRNFNGTSMKNAYRVTTRWSVNMS